MKFMTRNKVINDIVFTTNELPDVCILISVYNEAASINQKISNCFETTYPKEKIKVYIGSDGSTDNTIEAAKQNDQTNVFIYEYARMGKGNVINNLMEVIGKNNSNIIVLTDVNVLFKREALYQMVKHFKNEKIGLVGAWIHNILSEQDIAKQENFYIQQENHLKFAEGLWYGNMVGAFGAAYAIRPNINKPIPQNFVTDDLYITTQIALNGYDCIIEPKSIAEEIVYPTQASEFKRKKRFSAGNFQVLFYHLSKFSKNPAFAFCFFSHKVLRWKLPFLLFSIPILILYAGVETNLQKYLLFTSIVIVLAPFWNKLLINMGIENKMTKFVAYFVSMNVAIGIGFFNYIKGIKSNVWEPTKRN